MKIPCPRCGRGTVIDEDVGDFPTRCIRCGALVRLRREKSDPEDSPVELAASARISRGMLAGLLIRCAEKPPGIIHAHGGAAVPSRAANRAVLRPESRREILRARARQQALRKAQLKGSQQALGALTWAGLALVILLGIGALALKGRTLWTSPAQERPGVSHVATP